MSARTVSSAGDATRGPAYDPDIEPAPTYYEDVYGYFGYAAVLGTVPALTGRTLGEAGNDLLGQAGREFDRVAVGHEL